MAYSIVPLVCYREASAKESRVIHQDDTSADINQTCAFFEVKLFMLVSLAFTVHRQP